ncbi:MAG: hypothetical protein RRX92_03435 [Lachnospiraceae bacterium]
MKKFIKTSFIIAGVSIGIGIVGITVGLSLGGNELLKKAFYNHEFELISSDRYDVDEWTEEQEVEIVNQNEVQNVEIDMGTTSLYIEESQDEMIHIEGDENSNVTCYVKDGTLYLDEIYPLKFIVNDRDCLRLYLPKELILNYMDIELGAGVIDCKDLNVKELTVETGVGKVKVEDSHVKDMDISVDAGIFDYTGEVDGAIMVDCKVGTVDITIESSVEARESQQNYEIESAVGTVEIGQRHIRGLSGDTYIDNEADITYSIDCSVGTVKINFVNLVS